MGEAGPRHLVLLVEGDGDAKAVPELVGRLLRQRQCSDCLVLDKRSIRIDSISTLTGRTKNQQKWLRLLAAAGKRPRTAAVLTMLDGDAESVEGRQFCTAEVAKLMVERARDVGAGRTFSLAFVFARQEFESWLIAGVESLAGRLLPDGRAGVRAGTRCPALHTEEAPRDAKRWLSDRMASGYSPTTDQLALTQVVDLDLIRQRKLRSFKRLEDALDVLIHAVRSGNAVASPA